MSNVVEPQRETPVAGRYDVIVCGGGPSGFTAAVAAARAGARTLLIERYGILGGTATAAMMVEFGSIHDGRQRIVGGITREFMDRLIARGGTILREDRSYQMTFDPESMIWLCQEMAIEAGVELLLHTWVVGAVCRDGRVTGVVVENKTGRQAFLGRVVIDATGDGDVAMRAGARFDQGRPGDGKMQPVTLEVLLGNVDDTRRPEGVRDLSDAIREGMRTGEWPIPNERIMSWGRVAKAGAPDDPRAAWVFVNVTNSLDVDGTKAADLTRAEIETRRQVDGLVTFLRKHAAGFEHCYLDRTGVQVGIRETRRIVGDYALSRDDVLGARHFADGVVVGCNSIDVHDYAGKDFEHEYLRRGTHYQIPYRCFTPRGLDGLLVTGRCLSADHPALGSVRVMVVCLPMGEACGTAAAMAAAGDGRVRGVPVGDLRRRLRSAGHVLED